MTEKLEKKRAFADEEESEPKKRITRSKTCAEPDMAETTKQSEKKLQEFFVKSIAFADEAGATIDKIKADQMYRRLTKQTLPYTGNGSLRLKSIQCLLQRMWLNKDSVLLDMGSGPGNVLAYAALSFDVKAVIGIELDLPTIEFGRGFLAKNKCADKIEMYHGDLAKWNTLPKQITHVFAYDRVMPPNVLANMARMLNELSPKLFISFVKVSDWIEHGLAFKSFDALPGCTTTGGQVFVGHEFRF